MNNNIARVSALPEIRLLISCVSPAKNQGESIRVLADEKLDWELLLRLAARHAITPLLYCKLKAVSPHRISAPLETAFQENARNSLLLTGELLQLQQLFQREGIPVLPVKGPTLAMAAYGNLALRQFVDLDLLVPKSHALHARDLLLARGYVNHQQLSPRREKAYLRVYYEFTLSSEGGQSLVELQWATTPHFFSVPLEISPFWDRAESICLAHREVPSLCTEDLLLVLCIHGAKHCWSYLSLVADVAWLITRRPNVQWDALLQRARSIGGLRMVLLGLKLASSILEAPLPQSLLQSIESDRSVRILAAKVTARLFSPRDQPGGILRDGIFHMQAREHWQDRARYVYRLTTTPSLEDWQIVDLHPALTFLYPVLRFPRLLRKYWMRIP
jgi:hypothetical protein